MKRNETNPPPGLAHFPRQPHRDRVSSGRFHLRVRTPMTRPHRARGPLTAGLALLLFAAPLRADEPRPIELSVDATDAPRKLYRARLIIPAKPGPLTLFYPKWIQGEHQP